jgi:VWFA-related protein
MRISSTALAFLAGLQGLLAAPQKPAQQTPPVFKSSVDLVQVDVSVVDRGGRPVEGLTASDFTLLENGAARDIAAFAAVRVPAPETGSAAWLRDVPPDVRTNALGDGRLFALVIDDATMPFDLRTLSNVRRIARQVIDRMGPGDLVAVIYTRDSRRSIDFTNDRVRLLANVEALASGTAYADPQTDNWSYFSSVSTLGQVSSYLARVPQRRKALIYVSTGVPVNYETVANFVPLSASRLTGMGEEAMAEELVQNLMEFVESRPQDAYGVAMEDAFIRAQHGNVNIYSIDPAGLGGLQAFLERRSTIQQADRITRAPAGTTVRPNPLDAYQTARLSRDYLRTVAENSGGRAILETNDVDAGVAQIFRENSSYYLLGYRSTREPGDRRIRKVDVQVRRPDATAHTRNAYFDPRARPRRTDLTPDLQLANALSGVVALSDLPMQATAVPFAGPDRKTTLVALAVGIHHPVPGDVGARVEETLQLQATALTARGERKATAGETARLAFRSGVGEDAQYEVLTKLTLAPGRYQVRVAAQSALLGRNGSVYIDLDVPDFSGNAIQLSGVILSSDPAWRLATSEGFANVLPVAPTTVREFDATTSVSAFARVYDRAREPAVVRVTITDAEGATVFGRETALDAARFTPQGAADYRINLPISSLKAGRYLLTLEAVGKQKTASRQVRFAVK